jgi:hypothetical protein
LGSFYLRRREMRCRAGLPLFAHAETQTRGGFGS